MFESINTLLIVLVLGEIVSGVLEVLLNRTAQTLGIDLSDEPFVFAISQLSVLSLMLGNLYGAVVFWSLAVFLGSFLKLFTHQ